MLILHRKVGSHVQIGSHIKVWVHRLRGGSVWLRIDAPPEYTIKREEVAERERNLVDPDRRVPVLVVEDDLVHQELVARSLATFAPAVAKFVTSMSDGLSYLEEIQDDEEIQPRVILVDLELPDGNGMEIIKHVREKKHHAHTPVVVLTSSADDKIAKNCLETGASAFISKPTCYNEMRSVVRDTVDFWSRVTVPVPA